MLLDNTRPIQARVSGVVEESSSKLEYQVAVYRFVDENTFQSQQALKSNSKIAGGPYLVPLDDAVPIGTRLQLRTSIDPLSG